MNRFRQMDLNIENKILLQTLEDETDDNKNFSEISGRVVTLHCRVYFV